MHISVRDLEMPGTVFSEQSRECVSVGLFCCLQIKEEQRNEEEEKK